MTFLTHSVRKVDVDGAVEDFWCAGSAGTISAVGTGDGWREHAAGAGTDASDIQDGKGAWLAPGFIDLHAHGGGGFSFDDDEESIRRARDLHRSHGTTRSVISLVANPISRLCESLERVAWMSQLDPLILGSHLEGPFLAAGRKGAHHADYLLAPDHSTVETLITAADGTLCQVTVAPELPGAFDAIDVFLASGASIAIGHTESDYALAQEAFNRGACILTHAFNAMPGIHHRAPGPVVAAFEDERVTIELILDGVHVHPEVAHFAFAAAPGRIALVTDAMAASGSCDGDYRLGGLEVTVADSLAVLTGTDTIAGSTLTQDAALRNAITSARIDPVSAVAALTAVPARALGLGQKLGRLRPGFAADAVLLDDHWQIQSVRAAGKLL